MRNLKEINIVSYQAHQKTQRKNSCPLPPGYNILFTVRVLRFYIEAFSAERLPVACFSGAGVRPGQDAETGTREAISSKKSINRIRGYLRVLTAGDCRCALRVKKESGRDQQDV